MVPADYQELANRHAFYIVTIARFGSITRPSFRQISPALRDCHAPGQAGNRTKRNFWGDPEVSRCNRRVPSWAESNRPVSAHYFDDVYHEASYYEALYYDALYYEALGADSSARLSITLSTMPKSRAMSEVRNLSRSSASSIAL